MGFLQSFTIARAQADSSLVKSDRPGHKYISKRPDGKGAWIYKYRNPETGQTYEHGEAPVRDLKQWHATLRGARSRHVSGHAGPTTPQHQKRLEHLDTQIAHVKKLLAAGHTHASDTHVDGDGKEKPPAAKPEAKKFEGSAEQRAMRALGKFDGDRSKAEDHLKQQGDADAEEALYQHGKKQEDEAYGERVKHARTAAEERWLGHKDVEIGERGDILASGDLRHRIDAASIGAGRGADAAEQHLRETGDNEAADFVRDVGIRNKGVKPKDWREAQFATPEEKAAGEKMKARHESAKSSPQAAHDKAHKEAIEATKTAEASQHTYDTRAAFHDEAASKRLEAAKTATAIGKEGIAEVHRAAALSHQMKAENIRKEKTHSETGSLTQLATEGHGNLRTRAAKLHEKALASKSSKEVREASKEIRSAAHASSKRAQDMGRYSTTTHSASAQENANALHRHADTLDQHAQKLESRERAAATRETTKKRETATKDAMEGSHKPGTAQGKKFHLALVDGPKEHTAEAIHGDYAVHKHISGDAKHGYQVTHIPTGMSVSNSIKTTLSRGRAESLGKLLAQHAPGVMGKEFGKPNGAPGDIDKIKHAVTQWGAENYGAKSREPKKRPDLAGSLNAHIDQHNKETKAQRFAAGNYLKDIRNGKTGGEAESTGEVKKAMERATHENKGEDTMSNKSGFDMLRDIFTGGSEPIAKASPAPAKRRAPEAPSPSKEDFDYDPTIRAQYRSDGDDALSKGLYKFAPYGDRKMDSVPDEYLIAYLDAFIEEAYEHERAEPAHKNPSAHAVGGDTANYYAKFVFNELVAYMPCNSNLKRAAQKLKVNEEYIADRLRSLGSTSPMTQAGTFHGDFMQGFQESETENSLAVPGIEGYSPFVKGHAPARTRNMVEAAARSGASQDETSDYDYARARLAKGEEHVKLEPENFVPHFDEFPNPFAADTKLRVAPDDAPGMYDGAGFKS